MIKNKKQMFIVIGAFILVLLLGTTTYAFFNYTRTGSNNTIRVGRISFTTNQTKTINLTNVFPVDSSEVSTDTDNVGKVEITIVGDTDYTGGIEYLVSTEDTHLSITRGNKTVDIPLSVNIDVTNLGTENANYFTERDSTDETIYKKLVGNTITGNEMLLVGFIKPNTTSGAIEGINGKIIITAYFDSSNIAISDTYDGTESDNMGTTNDWVNNRLVLTTSEWNSLRTNGVSFKVKIEANEGIWVIGSIEEIMKKTVVMDNINSTYVNNSTPGIDFYHDASDTNGKGVYMRAGTEDDDYPIMYYRGEVYDNNVIFGNQCWKALRTTDSGGVRLIYNGNVGPAYVQNVPISQSSYLNVENTSSNPFTYDSSDNSYNLTLDNDSGSEIIFSVPTGKNYSLGFTGTSGNTCYARVIWYRKKSTMSYFEYMNSEAYYEGNSYNRTYDIGELSDADQIKIVVEDNASDDCIMTLKFQIKGEGEKITDYGCNNTAQYTGITVDGVNTFEYNYFGATHLNSSLAYSGYMHGVVYTDHRDTYDSNIYYGNGFTYENGFYKLTSPQKGYDETHHYSCNSTSADTTCEPIRYYYYDNNPGYSSTAHGYYIELSNGENINSAVNKMLTNVSDSYAKNRIDTWYENNILSYTNRLEDTIWCNNRTITNYAGWDPNGAAHEFLSFTGFNNIKNNNTPILDCIRKEDKFTVYKTVGNQNLTYPIALPSYDELALGGIGGWGFKKGYLFNGKDYWMMTPYNMYSDGDGGFGSYPQIGVVYSGGAYLSREVYARYYLRPVISLKPGQLITKGTGTVYDPYVIE